ncbi:MAG: bifunctional DNA primase/polymerase [Paracoccaceae bacterium]
MVRKQLGPPGGDPMTLERRFIMQEDGHGDDIFQGRSDTDLSDLFISGDPQPSSGDGTERQIPFLDANRDLIEAGASVHWLKPRKKSPAAVNWSDLPNQSPNELRGNYRPEQNIGIRLGRPSRIGEDYLHVMDLDIRDPSKADVAWAALLKVLPEAKTLPSVVSGSGGESRHIYFLTDQPFRKKKLARSDGFTMVFDATKGREVKKHDWEIDLMGTGHKPSCRLPSTPILASPIGGSASWNSFSPS